MKLWIDLSHKYKMSQRESCLEHSTDDFNNGKTG